MTALTERAQAFRSAITAFIEERREAKLKGKIDEVESAKFEFSTWINETARVAKEVQLTTHPIKATFPDAKITEASSPLVLIENMFKHEEIGSHFIEQDIIDGTGNAPSLRATRFVSQVVVEGKPLIFWVLNDDPDLVLALGDNAFAITAALKKTWRVDDPPSSHYGAKQVYWLTGDDPAEGKDYHLLQPLFSSSLAHAVHTDIQAVRFGEENKAARQARRDKSAHDGPYHEYRNLAVRKLGGTKPQNISQLNSERGGVNYLLSSLPPHWHDNNRIRVLKVDSVLGSFLWFEDVREQVKALSDFLISNPDPVVETRERREAMEQELGQMLALFGESIRLSQEPGWTRSSECRLPLCEQLWLDSERALLPLRDSHESEDADFKAAFHCGGWPDEVAGRFANWLNGQLHKAGLTTVGDSEYRHWARQAILDVDWPVPLQRRASGGEA